MSATVSVTVSEIPSRPLNTKVSFRLVSHESLTERDLPSGSFPANAAWLACAAISHNLLRAAGSLASLACARARAVTLRRDLIHVAARTARHGRGHLTLHLPEGWHRQTEWMNLFRAATGPPAAAA